MRTTKILLLTTLAAALVAGALLAQPGPPPGGGPPGGGPHVRGMLWETLAADYDGNGDGQITLEEFGGAEATFELFDRNGDGVLTEDDSGRRFGQRMRMHHGPGGLILRVADGDGDGKVTAAEWQALFDDLDADDDGEISEDELPLARLRSRR